jgi:hypothetical protein
MVARTGVPLDSALHAFQDKADYWDAYEVSIPDDARTALQCYLEFVSGTPKWIDMLMSIRNAVVRLFLLKPVGRLADVRELRAPESLGPGDRAGIFTIRTVCDQEVVLEIRDTHLDSVVSVYKQSGQPARLKVISMVFYHNFLGRLYMLPVAPMHRIIVRSILSRQRRPNAAV